MSRKPLQRHYRSGAVRFFYFDVADPAHARIAERAKKQRPEKLLDEVTRIDEF